MSHKETKWGTSTEWETAPISPMCEVLVGPDRFCEAATSYAYPAMGGGWMALCNRHAQKHLKHGGAISIETLIAGGERFK